MRYKGNIPRPKKDSSANQHVVHLGEDMRAQRKKAKEYERIRNNPHRDYDAERAAYAKEHGVLKSFFRGRGLYKDYDPETGYRTGSLKDRNAKARKKADPDPRTKRRRVQETMTRLKEFDGQKTAKKRTTEEGQRRNKRAQRLAAKPKGMKKGGMVKKSIDGIARRGKTRPPRHW